MSVINVFSGKNEFLSNFFPCKIVYNGLEFKCSEALYMAHKSGLESDFERFSQLEAKEAKKIGRTVKLQPGWDEMRLGVMEKVLKLKFEQNPELIARLLETGNAILIEGNWWKDHFWGVCDGVGENNLGKLLMKLRDYLNSDPLGVK